MRVVAGDLGGHFGRGPPPVTLRLHTAQWHSGRVAQSGTVAKLHSGKPPSNSSERFTADTPHSIPDTFADTYYYGERETSKLGLTLTLTPTFQSTITSSVNIWQVGERQ